MIRVTRTARRRLEFAAGGDGREALKTPQRRCQSVNLVSVKRATCVDNMSNTGYKGYINKGAREMDIETIRTELKILIDAYPSTSRSEK